eukprot:CAMPEP_0184266608 /NCGR_PEP_ID=MMETSP0977-20130417/27873_1 /TAXON_ID=483370 /ORGANISM="non described non described, Strain CCMP2097" /LENGTH=34 /DNA_ID= /DNA_START= /DNA_END= /DNA_ORIENTATION=
MPKRKAAKAVAPEAPKTVAPEDGGAASSRASSPA